ncbi:ABC transporter permease [Mollicutes bacterium LVI A0078]|nr:ABC transporter permease [Mollicutes bacterium LVI A0075]WOO91203.1 ABC transporter permease [Mollicutes bacterium LVI A0078]
MNKEDLKDIPVELFEFATDTNADNEVLQGTSLTFWQDAKMRFKKNRAAVISSFVLLAILVLAVTAPWLGAYHNTVTTFDGQLDPNYIGQYQDVENKFITPFTSQEFNYEVDGQTETKSKMFIFGTDDKGRDLYVRTMVGALVSIGFGLIAAVIDLFIGVTLGAISGYHGGKMDMFLQRLVEILGSVPNLIWVMMIIVFVGAGLLPLIMALVISGWIPMYRMVRAQVMRIKEQEYVLSARTLGQTDMGIIFKHILPNCMGVIIIWLMFSIPSAIFFESFMSFLGLGITAPVPSLGTLASNGKDFLRTQPYILFAPSVVLSAIMLSFNLIADGLRDAFDPKMRGGDDE